MTGSLQEKGGKYYAVLNLKDENNNRKQKWIKTDLPVKGNKRKAEQLLQKYLQEYSNYNVCDFSKMLFADYIEKWVNSRTNIQTATIDGYKHILKKHLLPYFKEKKILLSKMKPTDINAYYSSRYERRLSPNTVHKHHELIHACLNDAYNNDLVRKNIADFVEVPQTIKPKNDFYEFEEIKELFKVAKDSIIETPIILASYYGLRRSEVLGLTWSCVDFGKNRINIKQKVIRTFDENNRTISKFEEKLKSDSSYYSFPLVPVVRKHLEKVKQTQENNMKLFGNTYISNDFVCTWQNGEPLKPDYVTKAFPKLLKKNELRHICFHDLRHSCGSLLLEAGFTMKEVQEWLRHSNFNTTANTYVHCRRDSKQTIGNKLEEIFSNSETELLEKC